MIASKGTVVGTRLVEDHKCILKAIRKRDSDKARDATDEDLRQLIDGIDSHGRRARSSTTR